jgi:hypothetical protein
VIGNVQQMVNRNGNPASLNGVDTFFTNSKLIIPNAQVVEPTPSHLPDGKFFIVGSPSTVYQRDTFRTDQVLAMVTYAMTNEVGKRELVQALRLRMSDTSETSPLSDRDVLTRAYQELSDTLGSSLFSGMGESAGKTEITQLLSQYARDVAFHETLKNLGYTPMHIGANAWSQSSTKINPAINQDMLSAGMKALASKMGVPSTDLHMYTRANQFDRELRTLFEDCERAAYGSPEKSPHNSVRTDVEMLLESRLSQLRNLADDHQRKILDDSVRVLKKRYGVTVGHP